MKFSKFMLVAMVATLAMALDSCRKNAEEQKVDIGEEDICCCPPVTHNKI